MDMIVRLRFCVVCIVLLAFSGVRAYAQDHISHIAIIDTQKIVKASKAGMSIREQVKAERADFLDILDMREKALREEEQDLLEKKDTIPKKEFLKQRKILERKLLETSRFVKKSNRELEESHAIAMSKLQKKTFNIVSVIAEKKGYSLVLRRQDVFLAANADNITDDVLKALDAEIRTIPLELKE